MSCSAAASVPPDGSTRLQQSMGSGACQFWVALPPRTRGAVSSGGQQLPAADDSPVGKGAAVSKEVPAVGRGLLHQPAIKGGPVSSTYFARQVS